ncbi:GNAT family N-acetyltransferase [Pseudomonas sp. 1176_21]
MTTTVTVYIDQNERRAGVGRRFYAALLPILAQQGFRSVYAGISLPNAGSVELHESLGFNHVGTFPEVGYTLGKWHEVGYWLFELSGDSKPPSKHADFQSSPNDVRGGPDRFSQCALC